MSPARVLPLLALAAACSAPAPPPDLTTAERYDHAGHDEKALGAYERAAASCRRVRDKALRARWCAASLMGRAEVLERLGRTEEAARAYDVVPGAVEGVPDTQAAALVAAGRLYLRLGDDVTAWKRFWQAITDYPDAPGAEDALRRIVADGRGRDSRRLYEVLGQVYERVSRTEVADNLLYAMSDLARTELANPELALGLLDRLAEAYPKSPLRDDALWYGGQIAEANGDPRGALARWRRLLATRERSFVVGSYYSEYLDEAKLAVGRLLRDRLADPRAALRELEALPGDYPSSTLHDDALYETAVTWERLEDPARACAALARLRAKHPDSRYLLEDGPALGARLKCDGEPSQ